MAPYFVCTWRRTLSATNAARAERQIHALDPTMTLTANFRQPGNDTHMWLERPNDGTNDANWRRARNAECIEIVTALLGTEGAVTA